MSTSALSASQTFPNWRLDRFGTGTPCLFGTGQHPTTNMDTSANLILANNCQVFRLDLFWNDCEQALGVYAFNTGNAANVKVGIDRAALNGQTVIVTLKWSGTGNALYTGNIVTGSATQNTQYALFAQWAAKQLIGKVTYFEIFNEFDINGISGANYKAIVDAVAAVIKDVTNGNPAAKVVGAVTSGISPGNAVTYMTANSTSKTYDVYSFHNYAGGPGSGETIANAFQAGSTVVKGNCSDQSVRFIMSEFGWQDSNQFATPADMAQMVYRTCCAGNIDLVSYYDMYDDSTTLTWGLFVGTNSSFGNVIKPRSQAYFNSIANAHWATSYRRMYVAEMPTAPNTTTVAYRAAILGNGTTERAAFWTPNGANADTITVGVNNKSSTTGTLTLTDPLNTVLRTISIPAGNTYFQITLGNTPIVMTADQNIKFLPFHNF